MTRCDHGYEAFADCPRCGPRPVRVAAPAPVDDGATRWHGTVTTLGPVAKLAITVPLLFMTLVCFLGLVQAGSHPENAFLAVPMGVLVVVDIAFFPHVWERGHRRGSRSS